MWAARETEKIVHEASSTMRSGRNRPCSTYLLWRQI